MKNRKILIFRPRTRPDVKTINFIEFPAENYPKALEIRSLEGEKCGFFKTPNGDTVNALYLDTPEFWRENFIIERNATGHLCICREVNNVVISTILFRHKMYI